MTWRDEINPRKNPRYWIAALVVVLVWGLVESAMKIFETAD